MKLLREKLLKTRKLKTTVVILSKDKGATLVKDEQIYHLRQSECVDESGVMNK